MSGRSQTPAPVFTCNFKIETVWLNVYYGDTWTAKADYHLYIDDVVISHQRIGPSVASR